jgi:hypothetical protein
MNELARKAISAQMLGLRKRIADWEVYLSHNVSIRNWHGVEDAASDIRDFEAELKALEWVMTHE